VSDAPPSPSRPTAAFPQCLSCRILMRSHSAPRSFCLSSATPSLEKAPRLTASFVSWQRPRREQHGCVQARRRAAQSPGVHASEAQSLCGSCPHLPGVVSYKQAPSVPGCGRQGTNVRRHRCRVRVRHTCVRATCFSHATLGGGGGVCQPLPRGATDADPTALSVCARVRAKREQQPFYVSKRGP
jgi:hypothetical protein